jgi:hypothetical protein
MKTYTHFLIYLLLFCSFQLGYSQDTNNKQVYRVTLNDKSSYIGEITEETNSTVVLINPTTGVKTELPTTQILKKELLSESSIKNNEYWFENPNATRYLFGPSAFNLKKGEGYYQNTMLLLNSFNVGLTDYFSIGGGIEFLSTFISLSQGNFNPIIYFTPKVGFSVAEKISVGGGVLIASIPQFGETTNAGLGLVYGLGTYGNLDHNVTATIGWGSVEGDAFNKPLITVSGMTRVAKKTALVTENWLVPTDTSYEPLFSYGVRFFGENIAVDLAFINNWDIAQSLLIGIPYVNFVVKF